MRFSSGPDYPYKARWGSYGTGAGQLAYPRGLAVDQQGEVFVANTGNDRIDVFDRGGQLLRSFGLSGRASGQFDDPLGVAADASGIRAVTDSVNGRLELLNPDGTVAAVWGRRRRDRRFSRDPWPSPSTAAATPTSSTAGARGSSSSVALPDCRCARSAPRAAGPGQLLDPSALAIDAGGTISVADSGNERIARFGTGGTYLGATTGIGDVRGIAVTPDGSRTYATTSSGRIDVYDPSGEMLDEFGGRGSKLGKLEAPGQIALDAAGNLWVADRGNNRVQEFGPDGERLGMFGGRGVGAGPVHPPHRRAPSTATGR